MSASIPPLIIPDIDKMGFARYLNFNRISDLYSIMIKSDKSDMDDRTKAYMYGAMDAMMTILGSKTQLSRMIDLDVDFDEVLEEIMDDLLKRSGKEV